MVTEAILCICTIFKKMNVYFEDLVFLPLKFTVNSDYVNLTVGIIYESLNSNNACAL